MAAEPSAVASSIVLGMDPWEAVGAPVWADAAATLRGAASAMASCEAEVRLLSAVLNGLLGDVATSLGWRGHAAEAAQDRGSDLAGLVEELAQQLGDAVSPLRRLAERVEDDVTELRRRTTLLRMRSLQLQSDL